MFRTRPGLKAPNRTLRTRFNRSAAHVDGLELRRLLARSTSMCGCGACALCGLSNAEVAQRVTSPTIVPLSLSNSRAKALRGAGAGFFESISTMPAARNRSTDHVTAVEFTPFNIQLDSLKTHLARAPMEFTSAARNPVTLALPTPDGGFERFHVVEAPIMEEALADQFPDIKTYRGISLDDPNATVRLDYTPLGFHAQVLDGAESYYIDPYFKNDVNGAHLSYYKNDLARMHSFECLYDEDVHFKVGSNKDRSVAQIDLTDDETPGLSSITYGGTLKTYRAAVGASYQYTNAVGGGTVAGGQAAIVTAMNRVTGIYETELAIRMVLVANNSSLVYTNATAAQSFSNTDAVIDTSTSKINGIIGVNNYDIGHVFTTASGGVAFLGVVGDPNFKGGGTTGSPSPIGDAFYVDYVAHEMGHQFGAEHTFNVNNGQRNASTAFEPGTGVTIMGYAGLGGNNDVATSSIPYFHAGSIDEIRSFIASIPSVGTSTATGNVAPTVSAGLNYTIPTGTPFALTATGSDFNGDALTYDWQQMDLGASTNLNSPDNGASPLFRPFAPTSSPTRLFPRLSSILAGQSVTGNAANNLTYASERLPTVARTAMKFRVIARDNRIGGGGVTTADMQVRVVNTGAAFLMTSNNTASTVNGGSFQTFTWNVAGTTANNINVANVKISLSLNNGTTFPIVLAATTANDGSETIQMPYGVGAAQARIKVEAIGNIFFDINNAPLTLVNVPVPASATPATPVLLDDTGISATDGITNRNNNSPSNTLSFSVGNTVAGALVELLIDGNVAASATATGTTTTLTTNGSTIISNGNHSIAARQTETGKSISPNSSSLFIQVDTVRPLLTAAPAFNFETGHSLTYIFDEPDMGNFAPSVITVSDGVNTAPATISYDGVEQTTTVTFGGLLPNGNYTATLNTAAITDVAGNPLDAETPLAFFVLAGDANRDRVVGFDDLLIIAQNYETGGRTFSQGNVNYDAAGLVDFDDLLLLAQAYDSSLPALTSGRTGAATRRRPAADLL